MKHIEFGLVVRFFSFLLNISIVTLIKIHVTTDNLVQTLYINYYSILRSINRDLFCRIRPQRKNIVKEGKRSLFYVQYNVNMFNLNSISILFEFQGVLSSICGGTRGFGIIFKRES